MEREITQLQRLTDNEADVLFLYRMLGETEQSFFHELLKAQTKEDEQHGNVVRFGAR